MNNFKTATIGDRLKHWRNQRQISQLDLSLECDTSSRHISFIETGKAHPTRELVITLAEVLDIPVSARNNILIAAGYAPQYDSTGLDPDEMKLVQEVLETLVKQNGNKPSVVINRRWEIVYSNNVFIRFCQHFIGDQSLLEQQPLNLLRLVLHPQGLISACNNPSQLFQTFMSRARRDMTVIDDDNELEKLMLEMNEYKPRDLDEDYMIPPQLLTPVTLKRDDDEIHLLALTATLGEPINITLRELQLEFCIPSDDASEQFLNMLEQQL
jgi:transcriptional regulator with XRE-family HTH domain